MGLECFIDFMFLTVTNVDWICLDWKTFEDICWIWLHFVTSFNEFCKILNCWIFYLNFFICRFRNIIVTVELNAKLVFISGRSSNYIKLKTWDSFIMPKPFSKNEVYINEISYPNDEIADDIGKYISDKMNEIQNNSPDKTVGLVVH